MPEAPSEAGSKGFSPIRRRTVLVSGCSTYLVFNGPSASSGVGAPVGPGKGTA